jgi:aryl sulfotransferase
MLVFGSDEPRSIWELSPWPDMQLFGPIGETLATAEAQTHRRFLKSHMPYDALPVYEGVKFIHVARDGRDAAMSLHNHLISFRPETVDQLSALNIADPKFGDAYPVTEADPAAFFHRWVCDTNYDGQGDEGASFFHMENSFWAARDDPNILLVHYADLKRDRGGEMRRIAGFLDIEISEDLWPSLIEAAGFEAMKRQGGELIPAAQFLWEGGSNDFFNKGVNGRWQDVVQPEDIAAYEAKAKQLFEPALAHWVQHGRAAG